eukprot:evm.model.scf_544.2 EVM.evm.TU.scf_544.2   scf_544:9651-13166(+)
MASLPSAPSSPACLRVARGVGPLPLPPNARCPHGLRRHAALTPSFRDDQSADDFPFSRSWCHRTCRHPGAWDGQPFKHVCSVSLRCSWLQMRNLLGLLALDARLRICVGNIREEATSRRRRCCRAVLLASLGTDDGGLDEGLQTGSEAWRNRPAAISLPEHAQTPESWFVLAIFLKVVVFGAMWPNQLFLLVPVAVGLMLMTKYILNRNLHRRPRFAPLFVLCCAAVLFLLRAFA